MAMRRSHRIPALVALIVCLPAALSAEPKIIRLDALLRRLSRVTVGRCLGPEPLPTGRLGLRYRLQVDRVLLGDPTFLGSRIVETTGHVHVPRNRPCVAFFNRRKVLEWIAVPVRGDSLSDAPLRISGIYSFNAYFVMPHLFTLASLPGLLRKGTLRIRAEGSLYFVDPQSGRVMPSRINLAIAYDWPSGRASVSGLPPLSGFAKPRIGLGVALLDDIYVRYHSGYPRPLSIGGTVFGLQRNGTLLARFYVVQPSLLRLNDFMRYVANPKLQQRYYILEVAADGEPRWRIEIGKVDYQADRLIGPNGGPFTLSSEIEKGILQAKSGHDTITIRFHPPRKLAIRRAGRLERLVRELMRGTIGCRVTIQRGLGIAGKGCTLRLVSIELAPFPSR
ncbi:MAG: hypothetical protein KC609_17545 [Myxococcales bacterium]|nr:hypothetical protein [Myxococcales bacterium]